MRSLRLSVFAGLLTLAVAGCRAPAPTQIAKVEYPVLGGDTNALISVYERPTMFRVVSKTSGRDIVPGIDIYVDGQCSVRRFDGTELQKRIKPSELSALLGFFDESGFFPIVSSPNGFESGGCASFAERRHPWPQRHRQQLHRSLCAYPIKNQPYRAIRTRPRVGMVSRYYGAKAAR